ncbi:MAG: hypothetical protein IIA44_07175, partial [Acidobacteria bacterium]|nr:hypothetical protein [Acidobacteriota bacterium]
KWSQPPVGEGEDIPSNIDWDDLDPNIVVADDFTSDGRPINAVRWWGSKLGPICGDNEVNQPGEECDGADDVACPGQCLPNCTCPGDGPTDDCDLKPVVGEGTFPFSNVGADTDGAIGACAPLEADVWVNYVPTCDETATIDTCGSFFDTVLEVYEGCVCSPLGSLVACNDDAFSGPCAGTLQSTVSFPVTAGQCFKIRIGGFGGDQGDGTLTITCGAGPPSPCGPGAGDCCIENGTPGCEDETCCNQICTADPFCCDVEWDDICAADAVFQCPGCAPACSPAVPCTVLNGGFEDGNFCNWTATSNGFAEFFPWTVGPAGTGTGFHFSSPLSGGFDAVNGFDGQAGLIYELYQDVALPAGATITLTTHHRIQYDSLGIPSTLPRELDITIRDTGNVVQASLFHQDVVINGAPNTDLGWNTQVFDISAFAGQTVRVHFEEFIPESSTGPALIEFDDITLTCTTALAGQETLEIHLFEVKDRGSPPGQNIAQMQPARSFEELRANYMAVRERALAAPKDSALAPAVAGEPVVEYGAESARSLEELRTNDMAIRERALSALRIRAINEALAQRGDKTTVASAADEAQSSWVRSVKDRPSVLQSASTGPCLSSPVVDAFGDAIDTVGAGPPLLDIDTVVVTTDGVNLSFSITFHTPISAPSSGAPDGIGGVLDLDIDQNAATGIPPLQNGISPPFVAIGLGIEFFVDLFSEAFQPGLVDVLNASIVVVGTIPVTYGAQSLSGTIPLGMIGGDDGIVDFTTIIGTFPQPTDAMDVCGTSTTAGGCLLVNNDFESGTLAGWTQINSGSGSWVINDGTLDPSGPDGPLPPCGGSFSAITIQTGPGVHTLYQDVTIPGSATTARLDWTDMIRNHAGTFSDPNQEFRVEAWNPADNSVLTSLFSTNPGDTPIQNCTSRCADISSFIGQTIQVAFTEEDNLFFFNVHLDDVCIIIDDTCPTGACCLRDGTCVPDETSAGCSAQGGTYQGDGTVCTPVLCLIPCPPPTDDCDQTCKVSEGTFPYSNIGATTDGPDEFPVCDFFGDTQVASDVW